METPWPATMLWHVVVDGKRERITYGGTTTVSVRQHYAVAADSSHAAEEIARSQSRLAYPSVLNRTRAIQSGCIKMREGK